MFTALPPIQGSPYLYRTKYPFIKAKLKGSLTPLVYHSLILSIPSHISFIIYIHFYNPSGSIQEAVKETPSGHFTHGTRPNVPQAFSKGLLFHSPGWALAQNPEWIQSSDSGEVYSYTGWIQSSSRCWVGSYTGSLTISQHGCQD